MTQPKIDHLEAVPGHPESLLPATIGGVACTAFTLKAGWVQDWDAGNIGSNGKPNERAEISYAPAPGPQKVNSPVNVREGMLQTYDVDYRFKAGFPPHVAANHEWAVLTQFHPQDDHRAGVPQGFGGATVHDGQITFDDPMGSGSYFATVRIVPETWIKIRMAVKWSAGSDGYAVIQDRGTGALLGRYNGQTITKGEFKYLKQGYYRAGGLPEGTVYQSSPGGPLIDINEGDLTATAAPTPSKKKNSAPLDPTKPSVQPNDGAAVLMSIRDALVALHDPRVQPQIDAANKVLDASAWTP